MKHRINFTVNGEPKELFVEPNRMLVDLIRQDLGLTGTKKGCGTGDCGSCTIILDGSAVKSCLILAVEVDGSEILTIEGLQSGGKLHPLQEAFIQYGAIQCGFCSPGMMMSAKAFLDQCPKPTEEEVKMALSGNLCRCTGYRKIIEAILAVAQKENPLSALTKESPSKKG
ncbi:MAG: (2Fe-2S)-binding protein [Deltaproteobacteria bacterium]|nr:(2Fe-2S)-binding protein [Deltaproteobacteria bacterium]